MTKLILSAAALTMLLASCQKKDNSVATTTDGTSTSKSFKQGIIHTEYNGNDGPMRQYFDNGGPSPKDYGCNPTVENCAPEDIIIKGNTGITDFVRVIDRNNGITDFVRAHHDEIGQTIPTKYLDAVVNGSLILSMRGDVSASYRCILFKDKANAVTLAVPVIQ